MRTRENLAAPVEVWYVPFDRCRVLQYTQDHMLFFWCTPRYAIITSLFSLLTRLSYIYLLATIYKQLVFLKARPSIFSKYLCCSCRVHPKLFGLFLCSINTYSRCRPGRRCEEHADEEKPKKTYLYQARLSRKGHSPSSGRAKVRRWSSPSRMTSGHLSGLYELTAYTRLSYSPQPTDHVYPFIGFCQLWMLSLICSWICAWFPKPT